MQCDQHLDLRWFNLHLWKMKSIFLKYHIFHISLIRPDGLGGIRILGCFGRLEKYYSLWQGSSSLFQIFHIHSVATWLDLYIGLLMRISNRIKCGSMHNNMQMMHADEQEIHLLFKPNMRMRKSICRWDFHTQKSYIMKYIMKRQKAFVNEKGMRKMTMTTKTGQ